MATQNPIESEGTYPLPEAQLDRFMFKVLVGYPTPTQEYVVVERMTTAHEPPEPVIDTETLLGYQRGADAVYVDPQIIEYAVRLSTATRDPAAVGAPDLARYVTFGASPRASINMVLGAKALAFLRGRDYALPADVRELARDVLRHRIVLSYEALADDVSPDDLLGPLLAAIPPARELDPPGRPGRARPPRARRLRAPAVTELAALTPERVLRRLEWRVLRRLDGRLQGDYRTLFRGTGIDVADLREYQFGDDLRHVDWNVTARMDVAHVREYLEDREVTAWLLLDRSRVDGLRAGASGASTSCSPRSPPRWRSCSRAAATGSAPCSSTHGVRRDDPARAGPQPGAADPLAAAAARRRRHRRTTDLGAALRAALGILRRRSLVVIVSDFLSRAGLAGRSLGQLARRHDVVAIQVVDRREFDLPAAGMIYVEDAETGELIFVDTDDAGFQQRLRGRGRRAAGGSRRRSARGRARPAPVTTDEDLVRALFRIAHLRRRARSGGGDVTFAWPWLLVASRPSRSPWSGTGGCCAPGRPAAPSSPRSAWPRPAPGRRATVAPALFLGASRCCCRAGPARGRRAAPAPGGHRDPRVRRVASMAATDLAPTRMDAAKAAARAFVERQPPTVRVGVVAFSASGLVTQQPTTDRARVLAAIDRLQPQRRHGAGQRAADLAERHRGKDGAGRRAGHSNGVEPQGPDLGYHGSAAVVLLSDGENTTEPDPLEVAELASSAGVRVYPIGIGSPEGTVLEIDGFQVATALDEPLLRTIAERTDGRYFAADDKEALAEVYDSIDLELDGRGRAHRGHRPARRRGRAARARRRRALPGLVRAGGVAMGSRGRSRCCRCSPCRCSPARTCGSCGASAGRRCGTRASR